jgi:muconolactone delta-isomerase
MEYLVTMTTHVPHGTSTEAVEDIRTGEAARARELAAQGSLRRLWRPSLQPDEWRTLGLFAAPDVGQLEDILASMPLRVWRTDEVTVLSPHPNDPGNRSGGTATEFLTSFTIAVPGGIPDRTVEDTKTREAERARELAQQGHLLRLWMLPATPGSSRALGLWRAAEPSEMQAILESLPLYPWMAVETTSLGQHPNDPALQALTTGGNR